MDSLYSIKTEMDGIEVEYELLSPEKVESLQEVEQSDDIDKLLESTRDKITEINASIDRLTNHADGIDYAIAVTCGLVTGIIDATVVGEWNFKEAKAKSNQEVNKKIISFAQKDPEYAEYLSKKRQSNGDLENAISFLENKYKLPGDGEYKAFKSLGVTDKTHHLDDYCHHPTLVGLVCCVLVQFTGNAKYHCASGEVIKATIQVNEYGNLVSPDKWGKVFAGVINWFFNVAKAMANRKGHILSDIGGSSLSAGKGKDGAGLPGGFMATVKELSDLPCFKDTEFAENLRKAFQNGIGNQKSQLDLGAFNSLFEGANSRFDKRTEMAIENELKRQALPVVLNEILVRASFFVRRFIDEMRDKETITDIEWSKTFPIGNRTVERMITIASGTFTAVDMADATIRAAVKSGGFGPTFLSNMVLRVNFVGIGRFAIALGTDSVMGIKREYKRNKRLILMDEEIALSGAKLYYKQADIWIAAENTERSIEEMDLEAQNAVRFFLESEEEIKQDMNAICEKTSKIAEKNPEKTAEYLRLLRS